MRPAVVVESYLSALPEPATWERVRPDFWYVRIPGTARAWIPVEIELGPRTLKLTSPFCMEPEEHHGPAYRYLLAHNERAGRVAFASDREHTVVIVGRLPLPEVDAESLDAMIGEIVDLTEKSFRSFLRLGFPRFFRT